VRTDGRTQCIIDREGPMLYEGEGEDGTSRPYLCNRHRTSRNESGSRPAKHFPCLEMHSTRTGKTESVTL